uniref:hepatocyte growth factor-regulated tyrosine kinase substrate isoform X1 n=2 Tax=Myxine glutinosa TaxID=7769 RepID=UPI00358DF64C
MFRQNVSFEKLLDKATSQLLLDTDWDTILQICDSIRQGDMSPKNAVASIKKRVMDKNPHVSKYSLQVLESVVKNCGQLVHDEIATKQNMEELKDLCKQQSDPVKSQLLGLIQAWSHAFRNEPRYRVVQDTYQIMKMEGFTFPELKESDAMFAADKAPEWVDAESCHRCRVLFSMTTRKHHCRACGQIFCSRCSSRASSIPKFGIEREVRVCEPCFEQLNKKEVKAAAEGELPPEYISSSLAQQAQVPPKKDESAIQEEEELQLALALSQSEAEEKERKKHKTPSYNRSSSPVSTSAPPASGLYSMPVISSAPSAEEHDKELAIYMNRSFWEKKQEEAVRPSPTPSAPAPAIDSGTDAQIAAIKVAECYQNGESEENNEQFLQTLRNAVATFSNRMRSDHARGRSITNDTAVQSLFQTIGNMQPQLLQLLNALDEKRLYYESLQDKLGQIRDARAALNALREDHREKLERTAQEAEHQRQLQLAHKLQVMRLKKQEYLEMQRQLALRRLQDQEHERQMRLEQQKQTIQMRAQMPALSLSYGQGVPAPPGAIYGAPAPGNLASTFSPPTSVDGSPMHGTAYGTATTTGYGQATTTGYGQAQPVYGAATTAGQVGPQQYVGGQPASTDPNFTAQYPYQGVVHGVGQLQTHAYPYQASQYQEPVNQTQPPPQHQVPGAVTYPPVSMGYQRYGMQVVAAALPVQDQVPTPGPTFMAGGAPVATSNQQGYQQPGYQPPPAQVLPGSAEAELISFD